MDCVWTIIDNPITCRREIYYIHNLKFFMTAEILDDLVYRPDMANLSKTKFGHRVPQRMACDVIWEDIKAQLSNDVCGALKKMPPTFTPGLYVGELRWMSLSMMKSLIASKIKLKKK